MRIVVAHNRYKFSGGEDAVMHNEVEMLRSAGNTVEVFQADNRSIEGTAAKIAAAKSLFHSRASSRKMTRLLQRFRPDVLHIHNWFPLLSPSIISAAVTESIPVVQTLHNFRMICANGIMYRNGKICGDCIGKLLPLDGVAHACYSSNRIGTALVSAAFSYHRLTHTWDGVSIFIALSEFQRELLIRGGLDSRQIVVKPNFVKQSGSAGEGRGEYALFVGRLTPEKGIRTVLKAWEENLISIPLKIMGDGPLVEEVRQRSAALPLVEYLGQRSRAEIYAAMSDASFLIFSSEWHEPFPLTIVESLSLGTPVLAADLPSIAELVKDGQTGLRFTAGDADDLAAKAFLLLSRMDDYRKMRRSCRSIYEQRYTEKINYQLLLNIYCKAIASTQAYTSRAPKY
jgi:glycosyltransferase involved in cell wall biosynthesis